ncbi:MAG: M23 family metallopeptidase [Candidatus Margulisbacteria bacterium]|nr:M23 family metallopeptidase [Candidatus Margulisiibacteriota bacterium]
MDNKPKKQRYYTFMIVPHDARGNTISIKVPALWVYSAIGITLFSIVIVGSSVVYTSLVSRRLVHYYETIAKNREQQKMISSFSQETDKVHQAITELVSKDNELRKLLGLGGWKSKIRLSDKQEDKSERVSYNLKLADLKLAERKASLEELKGWVNTVRQRFATTPSRWPLFGQVMSSFGYRVYPWRGFHAGLDLSGSYGSPIRVTADGVVSYVGWRSGYGKAVIVDHGNGLSTLYGHCSSFAVRSGQQVKKGQLIAYVGSTGYSTGPHLHYEVRKWDHPVNPVAYLNLNILSASRVWRE